MLLYSTHWAVSKGTASGAARAGEMPEATVDASSDANTDSGSLDLRRDGLRPELTAGKVLLGISDPFFH
ncbi:MAG: hypothetical protein Sw1PiTSA_26090 [Shewanella algae]